jgi:hypothetical protein
MSNLAFLNTEAHRGLKVQPAASPRLGDSQRFIAVVPSEFPLLAVHYPILIAKDATSGEPALGVLLGFSENENLFLTEKGMDSYRPLNLQRGCFFAAGDQVAIDLDSPRIGKDGMALFDDKGQPSEYMQSVMAIFRELIQGTAQAKQSVETLEKLKLLEAIDINASFHDGSKNTLTGVFTIHQANLRALADEQVLDLFRREYLQAIYLMISSLRQLPVLVQMKARTLPPAKAPAA